MVKEFQAIVEGKSYTVVASDEQTVLLAAKAAGRAVLGIYDGKNPGQAPFGTAYLIGQEDYVSEDFLERIIRRHIGLPWEITRTKRLLIREFISSDWENLEEPEREIFGSFSGFLAYIRNQYPFYEYGMWAVVEKREQALIGTAGVKNLETQAEDDPAALEIGYQIHPPFRRKGYGREAVQAVVRYAKENLPYPLYARIREENIPSQILARQAGFTALPKESGTRIILYRYGQIQ